MKVRPVAGSWTTVVAALAVLGAAPAPLAHADVTRAQATSKALSALDARKGDTGLTVFGDRRSVRAGAVITQAGPDGAAQPGGRAPAVLTRAGVRSIRAPRVLTAAARSWLFYADEGPNQAFEHPGRVVLVDRASGKVRVSDRLRWVPLVDGRRPAFFRSSSAYQGKRYRVFERPWKQQATPLTGARAAALSAPARAAQQRLADALAAERSCALRISDTLGDFYDFGRVDKTRAAFGRVFKGLGRLNDGFRTGWYTAAAGRSPLQTAQSLIDDGCQDVLVYVAGGAMRSGSAVIGIRSKSGGTLQWHTLSVDALEDLVQRNPNVRFKLVFDVPFGGRFADALTDEKNVTVLLTAGGRDEQSFTYLPSVLGPTGLVRNTQNPFQLLEFTNGVVRGLDRLLSDPAEMDRIIAKQAVGRDDTVLGLMLARALDLGPSPFSSWLTGATKQRLPLTSSNSASSSSPINHTPAGTTPAFTTREDTPADLTLTATDADGDPLTFSVTGPPAHGTLTGTAPFLRYAPASNYAGADQLTYRVSDGRGGTDDKTIAITVTPENDAPTVTAGSPVLPPSYAENGAPVVVDPQLAIADADSSELTGARVTVGAGRVAGDVLAFTPQGGITGTYDAATGVLTLSGTAGVGAYRDALRSVTFASTSDDPGTARTIGFRAIDAGGAGPALDEQLTVVPSNDAPDLTLPGAQTVAEDGSLDVPAITYADPDEHTGPVEATLGVAHGTLTLGTTTGLTFVTGDGTGDADVALRGTPDAVRAALADVTYAPAANYGGAESLAVEIDDQGHTPGPAASDTGTVAITVTAVNDAPVNTVPGAQTVAEDAFTDMTGAFSIADVDAGAGSVTTTLEADHGAITVAAGGTVTGNTSDEVTIAGTVAQVNAALATVRYAPSGDFNGSDTLTMTTNDNGHTGAPGAKTDADTVALTVTAVNDAPVMHVPGAQTIDEDTPLTFDSALNVTDVDAGSGTVTVIASVPAGTLDTGTDEDDEVTITGTLTQVNAVLDGLVYTPAADDDTSRTITFTVKDGGHTGSGGEQTDTGTVAVDLTPVNDAPRLTTTAGSAPYSEGGAAVQVDGDLDLTDPDDTELAGATVTIGGKQSGDSLAASPPAGLTATYNASTGVLAIEPTGATAPLADVRSALRSVTFSTTNDDPTATRTLTFVADDGDDTGTATRDIAITAVNDAPVVSVGPDMAHFTENGSPVAVDPAVDLLDFDDADLDEATIDIGTGHDAATDVLAFTPAGGITVKSWTPATGTLVLEGTASKATWRDALRTVTFAATGDTPSPANRSVSFVVSDGELDSSPDAQTVTVDDVNDAPVNTVPGAQSVDENQTLTFDGTRTLSLADVDAAAGDELEVTLTVTGGTFDLAQTTGLTFSTGDGDDDATATFTGTKADLNAALDGLVYTPTPGTSGARELTLKTDDQGHTGGPAETDTDTVAITVNAENRPPVNHLPAAQTVAEDATLVFSSGNANALTITDPDAGSETVNTALGVTHGTLTLNGTAGLTFLNGTANGTSAIHVRGTLTDINAALNGLTFTPDADFNGSSTLSIATEDEGHTGVGGTKSDSDDLAITVTAVNDAPTANAPTTATVAEEETVTFSAGNVNALTVGDPDAGSGNLTAEVTVTHGTATLGGTAGVVVTGNGTAHVTLTGTASAINAALEGTTYTPAADYDGPATLTLDVSDNGNTGFGGAQTATDSTAITVTGKNDAPVLTAPSSASVNQDSTRTFSTGNGNAISVADVDAGSGDVELTLGVAHGTLTTNGTAGLTFTTGDGTSDAAMVFRGTLANVNAALNGLVYRPASGYFGSDQLDVDVSDLGHDGTGGALTDSADVAITVNEANTAPVNTVPGAQTLDEDTTKDLTLAVSDANVDAATGELEVDLDVDHGVLTLDGTSGLTFTAGDGTSDAAMTFRGTPNAINAALDTVRYTPDVNFNGSDTLTLVTDDLGASGPPGPLTDTDTVALTVSAVNDAPAFTVPGSLTAAEDSTQAIAGVSIADVDAGSGDIRARFAVQHGTLTLGTTSGLTFSTGDGTADPEIVAEGTVGELNAALATLSYTPSGDFNGADVLDLDVSDLGLTGSGGAKTDTEDVPVTVTAVNDAPVNTVPGAQTIDEDTTLTLSNGAAITVADVDAGSLRVTVQATQGTLTLSGTAGLTFTTGDGSADTTMTFTGTKAAINTALNGLTYTPNADYNGVAGIGITTNDEGATGSGGAQQDQDTVAITVNPVNDAPVLTQPDAAALTYTEDSPSENHADAIAPNLTVADVDDASIASATVTLSALASGDDLTFTNQNGITGSWNSGTGVLTLTGSSSKANYETALRSVKYRTTSENPDTTQRTVTFRVNDGHGANNLSNQVTRKIDVVRTNDAPVAGDETFSGAKRAIGNTSLVVDDPTDGAPDPAGPQKTVSGDILANDTDVDTPAANLTVEAGTFVTTGGGTVTLQSDGDFTYLGERGCDDTTDSFVYEVRDNDPTDPKTGLGQVNLTSADCVWYIDNTVAAEPAVGAGGTSQEPFKTFLRLSGPGGTGDPDEANDKIFVSPGSYPGGFSLEAGEQILSYRHGLSLPDGGSGTTVVQAANAGAGSSTISGSLNLSTDNTVQGVDLGSNSGDGALRSSNPIGTATINTVTSGAINNPTGGAIRLTGGGTLNAKFSSATTNGAASAIALTNINGSLQVDAGTLTGATGPVVAIDGGAANVTIDANVTDNDSRLVSIANTTGGTKDFNGPVTDGSNGQGGGVALTNNTGATIRFDGGMRLVTGTTDALAATGGGTLAVTDPPGVAENLLDSSTGTALNVTNTTIHADGLTFRGISSNGAARGIVLNHTGTAGSLAVTSTGSGTCDGTSTTGCNGGTIRNSAGGDDSTATPVGTGIVLNDTVSPTFTRMHLSGHSNYAVRGTSVAGLTMRDSVIDGTNGTNDADPYDDSAMKFNELTGSALLERVRVSGGYQDNVSVENTAGTLNRFTLSQSYIGPNSTAGGNDGLFLEALAGTPAVVNATIDQTQFVGARGDQAQVTLEGTNGGDLVFTSNTLSYNAGQTTLGGGVAFAGGRTNTTTMNVAQNTVNGASTVAIKMLKSQGTGQLTGTVQNNTIGTAAVANSGSLQGSGFSVDQRGGGRLDLSVLNNTIRQYNNHGIELVAGGGAGVQSGQLNARIDGNTIANPGTNPAFTLQSQGIHVNSGTAPGDTYATCLDFGPNTINGSGRNGGTDFRLRQRQSTTVKLINPTGGYTGAPGDLTAVANFVKSEIGNAPSGAAVADYPTSGGGFVGGTSCP